MINGRREYQTKTLRGGFCYLLSLSDGTIKVGRTTNLYNRISTHIVTYGKLGISIKKIRVTDIIENSHDAEFSMICALRELSSSWIGERFFGTNEESAIKAAELIGVSFLEKELSSVSGMVAIAGEKNIGMFLSGRQIRMIRAVTGLKRECFGARIGMSMNALVRLEKEDGIRPHLSCAAHAIIYSVLSEELRSIGWELMDNGGIQPKAE